MLKLNTYTNPFTLNLHINYTTLQVQYINSKNKATVMNTSYISLVFM